MTEVTCGKSVLTQVRTLTSKHVMFRELNLQTFFLHKCVTPALICRLTELLLVQAGSVKASSGASYVCVWALGQHCSN